MKRAIVVALVVIGLSAPIWGDDLNPPTWRGQYGSQYAIWEFLNEGTYSGNPLSAHYAPDCNTFVGYTCEPADLIHIPGTGAGWHALQPTWEAGNPNAPIYNPEGPSGDGWLNLSGSIEIDLCNYPVLNPHKEIWLQFTWEPQAPGNVPEVQVWSPLTGFSDCTTLTLVHEFLWGPGIDPANPFRAVNYGVYHFDLNPNPNEEKIFISGGVNVDEVVVDTICYAVPEPASMLLVGSGVVGLFGYIRRKRMR